MAATVHASALRLQEPTAVTISEATERLRFEKGTAMANDDIRQINKKLINRRLQDGLALLREYYMVSERTIDPEFANPVVGGRPNKVRCFDIWDVGNLLLMSATDVEEAQLSSFVIMPYYKNLPLFSTDYVYTGENRIMLIEAYDLAVEHDELFDKGIASLAALDGEWDDMAPFTTKSCWYDDIRPVCIAKTPSREQDELALWRFRDALDLFIKMERMATPLDDAGRARKWELNKAYSDRLIDEGGVATDLWTAALGAEKTRRFFDEVFFGPANYKI